MRFSEIDSIMPDQFDFVPRERHRQIWYLIFGFLITMAIVVITAYTNLLGYTEFTGPMAAVLVISLLGLYTLYRKQKNLDLVMSTEYQNMLFSQALGQGFTFIILVRYDGTIVHTSDGIFEIFPGVRYGEAQALEAIFEQGGVLSSDRERINGAIRSGAQEHLIFPITNRQGKSRDYILTVEPLARPSGFSIVRGREFQGQRAGVQRLPDILRTTTIEKLEHLLLYTSSGHFILGARGQFEYVNPGFEKICGYLMGEIVDRKLSLHHLFFSVGDQTITEESVPVNFRGAAIIQCKDGSHLPVTLTQHILRDAPGKTIGATGTIIPAHA